MRLFTALFDIALLPLELAKDVVMALPDISSDTPIFDRTRDQCGKIDDSLHR